MKISYRRTGGFAGMVMRYEVDTNSLSTEEAEELSQMVDSADFFALPSEISSTGTGADQFEYQLIVETEGQQHTVKVGDAVVPEDLWPLLNKLRVLSRSNRNP
jgi:hypothetical protein